MIKKIIIISLIICLGGIVVLTFSFLRKQQVKQDFQSIKAVPINSFCVVTINNIPLFFKNTLTDNQMWQNISNLSTIATVNNGIREIEQLCGKKIFETNILNNKTMHISMHFTGNTDYNYLFTLGLETESNTDAFIEAVNTSISSEYDIKTYTYDNYSIYNIVSKTNPSSRYYFASIENMVIISKSKMLIQTSIGQIIANESLLKDESFKIVYNSSDREKPVNLFINYKTLPKYLSFYAHKDYYKKIAQTSKLANWAELDLSLENNSILLNGYITTDSLSDNFFHLFSLQEPVTFKLPEIIPSSASLVISIGVSDPKVYKQTYTECLRKDGSYSAYKKNVMETDSICNDDIEALFYEIIKNELCLVTTGNNAQQMKDNAYVIINTNSKRQTEEKLIGLLDSYCQKNKVALKTLKSELTIDNDIVYPIYRMPISKTPTMIFGNFFSLSEANYFTFIENYLVFGNSISSLSEFIKGYLLGKTLQTDKKFQQFIQNIPEQYNFMLYSKIPNCIDFFKEFVVEDFQKSLDNNYEVYSKHQLFSYQLSNSKGKLYNTIYSTFSNQIEQIAESKWDCKLDTSINAMPVFVYNCSSKEYDILVQDNQLKLYLIDKNGRKIWEKTLTEKILSNIFEVDYLKNGKIQYAFNSENYIYIIDRLGNFVDKYPLKLSNPASTGMYVADIHKKRDYRFYVPSKNKEIVCYTQEGKRDNEWSYKLTDKKVQGSIRNFKLGEIDILTFFDQSNLNIVDKKGNKIITTKEIIEPGTNSDCFKDERTNTLVTTNSKGQAKIIDIHGNVKTVSLGNLSKDHYFTIADINRDGTNEYIVADANKLMVYTTQGVKLISYSLNKKITSNPVLCKINENTVVIGVVCKDENKFYLFNDKGNIIAGFPIETNSLFSIGRFKPQGSNVSILLGNNNNLCNYELK